MTLRHIVFDSAGKAMLIYGIVSILLCGLVISSPALAETPTDSLAKVFVSPFDLSPDDIVLDISPDATRFIEGAVNINYEDFMGDGGQLKSAKEIASLLGDAGLSSNDSLVIAGECLPCGGGPSPAFFSYWLLKYLGHERVRILEGHLDDWASAGLNISNSSATRQKTEYVPHLATKLLATYEFVVNGGAQIVDARLARDYAIGSIPGAVNIAYENVLSNESIKPVADLEKVFAKLEKDRPVVVYTNVGVEASLVWLALNLSGYDARLYTWRDWLENQPKFNFELIDIVAKPNPVKTGSTTTITASFQEKQMAAAGNSSGGEAKLTIKGCATCGFEGFALGTSGASGASGNKSGTIQLSSSGKTSQSSAAGQDNVLRCTAVINALDGSEVASTSLLRTSGYKYVGIWSANVAPGIYKVSIAATSSKSAETFEDVLKIEVTG
ncbi:MAG: rhodanese-like domain-containing protein [Methanothrix sp.]|nr:rhodanese-like domain-containing protein [Methanothrix sp.]MDD4448785.1 rhodanese-like domain-containing protein [Methanothrix sp.]